MMDLRHTAFVAGLSVLALVFTSTGCGTEAKETGEEGRAEPGGAAATSSALDAQAIAAASGAKATTTDDGVVHIGWSRDDVEVTVGGMAMPPPAGLGSWAAFAPTTEGAMVMGDNVVFRDEVDAAIDAAFAHGLEVTALHNHFFYDDPKVYFMHIAGQGTPAQLAVGVKAMWDAIKEVRRRQPQPADGLGGPIPEPGDGRLDPRPIARITGLEASVLPGGVVKVTAGRESHVHGRDIGGSMGLTTWAAFSGSDESAAIDGDFAMQTQEVTPVLRALRSADIHVVALHNHMLGESPPYTFVHFWAVGPTAELARGFKEALDTQRATAEASTEAAAATWTFDGDAVGELPSGFRAEGTNQRGAVAAWSVERDGDAASPPNVLALTDTKDASGGTFNLCWTDRVRFGDGTIEVKVKAGTGREDQGGGPIWRVRDKDNYYIARWNPLEDNFRLYSVKSARRVQLATATVEADPKQWHTIRIEQTGDEIRASLDGESLLEARDATFGEAGGVGVWTKADAATSFDDLTVSHRQGASS